MGVSSPILESVIFCHQEDSNWPLSETTVLKKRFDDIFASTRYSKALDVIKKQKKEIASQIKEAKLKLETVQANKEFSELTKKKIAQTQNQLKEADQQMQKLRSLIAEKEKKLSELRSKAHSVQALDKELQVMRASKREMANQNKQTLENELKNKPLGSSSQISPFVTRILLHNK